MPDSFVTPRTVTFQAPVSMGFPRQEYWSGLPFPSPGDLPDPGIKLASPALAGRLFTTGPPGKPTMDYSVQFSSVAQSCLTLQPHALYKVICPFKNKKEMTSHSSILAWEIPWTEEPGWLQSMGLQNSWTQLSD